MVKIDTHVHIDLFDNAMEIAYMYEKNKIYTIFVTNSPEHFESYYKVFKKFEFVRLSLGYHPNLINKKFNKSLFLKNLPNTDYIGEIGLDFNNLNKNEIEKQVNILDFCTSPKFNAHKIYNLHTTNETAGLVLDILKKNKVKNAIFHWYTGGLKTLDDIVIAGYYLSVNPQMLNSKRGLKILERIPVNSLLFETDSPYTRYKRKLITPNLIDEVYKEFESIYPNFEKIVFNNFRRLLIAKDLD